MAAPTYTLATVTKNPDGTLTLGNKPAGTYATATQDAGGGKVPLPVANLSAPTAPAGTGLATAIYEAQATGAQTVAQAGATWFGDVGIVIGNGKSIPLSYGSGYTFTTGSLSLLATAGVQVNDLVTYTYASGNVAGALDAYTKTQSDARFADLATQQRLVQEVTTLIRVPAFTNADFGKVLGLTSTGVLAWVTAGGIVADYFQMLFDGDSLTFGYASTNPAVNAWPARLKDLLSAAKYGGFQNFGVSGQTIVDALSDVTTQVVGAYDHTTFTRTKLFTLLGINDLIHNGATVADLQQHITQYVQAAKDAKTDIYLLTLPASQVSYGNPNAALSDVVIQMRVDQYNAWLRTNAQLTGATDYIDIAADAQFQNPANGAMYNADRLHFTDAGYLALAQLVATYLATGVQPGGTYAGAVAPEFVEYDSLDTYKLGYSQVGNTQVWKVAATSRARNGALGYIQQGDGGSIALHGKGGRFALWAPTGAAPSEYKGAFAITIDGGSPISCTQAVDNPDGSGLSWAYYTSPQLGPGPHTVVLDFPAQAGVAPIFDGIQWLA